MSRNAIIGIAAAILVIICAFLPWISISLDGQHLVLTGMQTRPSRLGEPGKLNIAVSAVAIVLFLIRTNWVPKVNLFVTAFLIAWTFRNMLLFSRCAMGICPEKEPALYLSLAGAFIAFFCVLFHKMKK